MLQFYFLSILVNLLIGITLVYGDNEKISILDDKTFHLVVGILAVFVGVIKFLSAVKGVPFLGDLLPAMANILGGGSVLVSYYLARANEELSPSDIVQFIFIDKKKYIGIGCIAIAVIHFIVPDVLFL